MKNNENFILAIDMGTQSVRAVAFDIKGNILDMHKIVYEPISHSPQDGFHEQDVEYYWECLGKACRNLWKQNKINPKNILGLSVTTQRGTVVNLDKNGKALRPAILWFDKRINKNIKKITPLLDVAFNITKLKKNIDYFQKKAQINWIEENQPKIWDKTEHYLLLSGYINYRLTTKFIDSTASQVGYIPYNYKKQNWEEKTSWKYKLFRVKPNSLPKLIKPSEIIGKITTQASKDTLIPIDTLVFAAASDKACEIAGSGMLKKSDACIGFGTTATISTNSKKYIEPIFLAPAYTSAKQGYYNPEVQIFRGFWMVTWFKEQFAHPEALIAQKKGVSTEEILEELATKVPAGSLGLTLQPYWTPGVRFPGLEAKGSIIGFNSMHKKQHIYRAILEGLAYGIREGKEKIEKKSKIKMKQIFVTGGGSKSDLVMQITADILNTKTIRPKIEESSALGAAVLTAIGLKIYDNYDEAVKNMTSIGDTFKPNPQTVKIYDKLYKSVYKNIYKRLKPIFHSIKGII